MKAFRLAALLTGAVALASAGSPAGEFQARDSASLSVQLESGRDDSGPEENSCPDRERVDWMSYEQAVAAGKERNLPVMVYFYSRNCRQCELLEKNGFNRPDIACYINRKLAPARVNARERGDLKARHRVNFYPTVWFLTPESKEIDYFTGYLEPAKLKSILLYIGEGAYQKMSFEEFEKGR